MADIEKDLTDWEICQALEAGRIPQADQDYWASLLVKADSEFGDVPRPGNAPFFIPNQCENCQGPLKPGDLVYREQNIKQAEEWAIAENLPYEEPVFWWDEFACPQCKDGIYHDWPEGVTQIFTDRMREGMAEHAAGNYSTMEKDEAGDYYFKQYRNHEYVGDKYLTGPKADLNKE